MGSIWPRLGKGVKSITTRANYLSRPLARLGVRSIASFAKACRGPCQVRCEGGIAPFAETS